MKKLIFGLAVVAVFCMPIVASASTLSSDQVNAILAILQAFGVDQGTINIVQGDLEGTSTEATSTPNCLTFVNADGQLINSCTGAIVTPTPIEATSTDDSNTQAVETLQSQVSNLQSQVQDLQQSTAGSAAPLNGNGCPSGEVNTTPTNNPDGCVVPPPPPPPPPPAVAPTCTLSNVILPGENPSLMQETFSAQPDWSGLKSARIDYGQNLLGNYISENGGSGEILGSAPAFWITSTSTMIVVDNDGLSASCSTVINPNPTQWP